MAFLVSVNSTLQPTDLFAVILDDPGPFKLWLTRGDSPRELAIDAPEVTADPSTWTITEGYSVFPAFPNDTETGVRSTFGWPGDQLVAELEADGGLITRTWPIENGVQGYAPDLAVTEDGLDLLLYQFKNSTKLRALLASYLDEIQLLRRSLYDLRFSRDLDTATDGRLDGIGKILDLERGSFNNDEVYRRRLKAQRAIITSNGTLDELINVVRLLLDVDTSVILATQYYPESVFLRARNSILHSIAPSTAGDLLRRAAPSGYNIQLIYTETESSDDDLFRFSDTAGTSETSSSHGFGNGTFAGAA